MLNNEKLIGVIFASGKGSRLYPATLEGHVPKHLLQIPYNGSSHSIVSRIVMDLSKSCSEVFCTVDKGKKGLFDIEFKREGLKVNVLEKQESGFGGDVKCILNYIIKNNQYCQILLATGDLVFPEGEIGKFIQKTRNKSDIVIGFRKWLKFQPHMCLLKLPCSVFGNLSNIDPESTKSVFSAISRIGFNRISFLLVDVLYNLNSPDDYRAVNEHLF